MKNAHDYPGLYDDLGIDLRDLGCLMIDTESPLLIGAPKGAEYVSPDPKKFWVDGLLDHWHVTARYGMLPQVTRAHVDRVLEDIGLPETLSLKNGVFDCFPSPYPDEPYDCVVYRLYSPELQEINAQLSVLPNLNTFVEYKPHITIGYFKPGYFKANRRNLVAKGTVRVLGYNYGSMK